MKKEIHKTILKIGLLAVLTAGTGLKEANAAIQTDKAKEPYEVAVQMVVLPGTEIQNEADIEEAIDAITLPAINCTVDLQFIWISELPNTTNLAIAGNEKIDLIHVGTVQPLSSLVGADILYDMNTDDLLQKHGQELVSLYGKLLESGNVNGRQLAIPAKQFNSEKKGFYYNKTIADKLGITVPDKGTLDDFEKVLYQVKASGEDIMCYFVGGGDINLMAWMVPYEAYGNEAAYGAVMDSSKDTVVENLYATEEYRDYVLRMYKWRQDGIIEKDPADTTSGNEYQYTQRLFCGVGNYSPIQMNENQHIAAENGFEYGYMTMVEAQVTNSSVAESMWGIARNSERPDKALEFLNLLYSNAEVANIMKYGLEGENYNFVEGSDDIIERNNSYFPMFYVGGNQREMYLQTPAGEDFIEQCEAQEKEAKVSPLLGYTFDDTNYQTEAAVIGSVISEYTPILQNGLCGSEEETMEYLDEFLAALDAAGMNEVIEANQAQLDAWLTDNSIPSVHK